MGGVTSASGGRGGSPGAFVLPDAATVAGDIGAGGTKAPATWPPKGFINVTNASFGAYALGPPVSSLATATGGSAGQSEEGRCAGLLAIVRDFKTGAASGGHPDFEKPPMVVDRGIVTDRLGSDHKPVYASGNTTTKTTSGQTTFDQWFRDTRDVNQAYVVSFRFVQNGDVVTFAASIGKTGGAVRDSSYFPLDGQGFGNEGNTHNYHFTTEIHTTFTYNGGEIFTFQGDDDVFVYINGHRVIDLGGIHEQETQTVDLDADASRLELSKGNVYALAVFNAERHKSQSNFRIDTTMVFEDCGQIIP
jgi:fibro-slime domain-containing protein